MKYLPSTLLVGLLVLTLHAQTPPPAGDPFIKDSGDAGANAKKDAHWLDCLAVLEAYALDKNDALAVLEAEPGSGARYRRVLDLAKSGKARLEILSALTTKSGQRAVCESNDEVRYPTEFAAPITTKGMAAPTAWETRNVGDIFEFEPVIGPNHNCDMNLVPQHISLVGFRDAAGMAGDAPISQPIFNTQKITSSTTVTDREPHYLGSFSPPAPQGAAKGEKAPEVWLAFLHVSLQGPAGPENKPAAKPAANAPVNLEYSCYSVDRTLAREILVAPASIDAPWEKLQALIGEKKAQLEHIMSIKTNSGQRAVSEETQEVRYMTEYVPESRVSSSESTQHYSPKAANDKNMTLTENVVTTRIDANAELIPGHASAFETRSAGASVEVEPVIAPDGQIIDVNHVVQNVKYLGDLKTTGIALRYPAIPLFETSKVTTSQTLPAGRHMLVSTLNPPGADGVNDRVDTGRTWLLFVRATIGEP